MPRLYSLEGRYRGDILLPDRGPADAALAAFSSDEAQRAYERISAWPVYAVSPLVPLSGLAEKLGLGQIWCKDESHRLGLSSFKAMGAVFASVVDIAERLEQVTGAPVSDQTLLEGGYSKDLEGIFLTCCTDGNHGFSVAWAARRMGCGCKIYIPRGVSAAREQALRDEGAEVVRIDGTYDEAYAQTARDAAATPGAVVISDSATRDYMRIPRIVMSGYSVMVREILDQLGGQVPSHVMLPAGCGGMAGAVIAAFDHLCGEKAPAPLIVEPLTADCVFASIQAGHEVEVEGNLETVMGGLSCAAVSHVAWPILRQRAAACLRIEDAAAIEAMRVLACPEGDDQPIVAGETGGAGLAGILALAGDDAVRKILGLNESARVLLFNCEGATDRVAYRSIVGGVRSDELGVKV